MSQISPLQAARATYQPKLPSVLNESGPFAKAVLGKATKSVADQAAIKKLFPDTYGLPAVKFEKGAKRKVKALNVAVILSGGQAPGGHNVIAGLYDGLKALNAQSKLYGFLGGPSGLIDNKYMLLTDDICLETEETFNLEFPPHVVATVVRQIPMRELHDGDNVLSIRLDGGEATAVWCEIYLP